MTHYGWELLKSFEGFEPWPYEDAAGVLTVGYGTTFPLSKLEAQALMGLRLAPIEDAIRKLVKVPLNDHQHDALVSFTYNVGIENLTKSTLLRLLNEGKYDAVPKQLARWNRAGEKVLAGLKKRRAAEAELWISR
jgi:lysozyme